MKKSGSSNVFVDGLIMDMNPMVTPNSCLTDALNATIITMNGNENMLQQDMGNGRVETAYLPTGYVPVGTAELGGIIYIVSYNPLIDKCLIGSFPSPERNITSDEVSPCTTSVTNDNFQTEADGADIPFPIIKSTLLRLNLLDENEIVNKLMPGDKYKIYAINDGISGNTSVLSDVIGKSDPEYLSKTEEDENHVVDDFPKYITIHVVAIADDGKIIYLDDTLKWMNTKYDYYIDELNENNNTKDIDSYRNLVSTAYNIFNSKISGELALLFEVKTIDSFSATWDAIVEDTDNVDFPKKATFKWYFNWESSDAKINPAYIILTKSEGVATSTLIDDFGQYEVEDNYTNRKNDGFDSDVTDSYMLDDDSEQSKKLHISFSYNPNADNHIWEYEWTPAMKYGLMEWLAISGNIDLSLLGTGAIYLSEWRYYMQENNFILSWGLACYPEYNKQVKEVIFDFIHIDKIFDGFEIVSNADDSQERRISDEDVYANKYLRYTVSGKNSYSGNFSDSISYGETTKIKSLDGTYIEKNQLYLVAIGIVYGNDSVGWKYIYEYRWLYTTGQWNTIYEKAIEPDFGVLFLDDVLSFNTDINTSESIIADTYNTTLTIPDTTSGSILGMKTYAIGYDLLNSKWADSSTAHVDISTSVKNYPELFLIEKLDVDIRTSSIGEKTVTRDPDNSIDALKSSNNKDSVKSKTGDDSIERGLLLVTINNVLNNNITTAVDDSAVDWFYTSLDGLTIQNDSFDFNLYGAIFSRINGELKESKSTPSLVIRPLLFYDSDLKKYNMYDNNNGSGTIIPMALRLMTISQHNSSGDPIALTFSQITVRGESGEESTRSTLKKEWNPGDTVSATTWYSDSNIANMYSNIMNPELKTAAAQSPFCFVIYNLGAKHSDKGPGDDYYNYNDKSKREEITYAVGLWVNVNDIFLPLYDFIKPEELSKNDYWTIGNEGKILLYMQLYKDGVLKTMSKRLALFLMQVYYVDTSMTTSVTVILISNIFRLNNYYETWSVDINSELSVANMNNTIFIKGENSAYSLTSILDALNIEKKENDDKENDDSWKFLNNITYSIYERTVTATPGNYSHKFTINTDDIYDIYEEKMGLSEFAVIFLCDEENCKMFDLQNSRYLYVYDSGSGSLLRADQNSNRGKYVCTYNSMNSIKSEGNEDDRFILSDKVADGESSDLMYALLVDEGKLSFDIDLFYYTSIEMYFHCKSGHIEITRNCGSKLPIKY